MIAHQAPCVCHHLPCSEWSSLGEKQNVIACSLSVTYTHIHTLSLSSLSLLNSPLSLLYLPLPFPSYNYLVHLPPHCIWLCGGQPGCPLWAGWSLCQAFQWKQHTMKTAWNWWSPAEPIDTHGTPHGQSCTQLKTYVYKCIYDKCARNKVYYILAQKANA